MQFIFLDTHNYSYSYTIVHRTAIEFLLKNVKSNKKTALYINTSL